jgi:DNA segregation ATPase FtsK/SpoIIIE, S-DNA-T family
MLGLMPRSEKTHENAKSAKRLLSFVLALSACLALLSHHPEDLNVLAGGIRGYIENRLGRVGAIWAAFWLNTLGLASYLALGSCSLALLLRCPLRVFVGILGASAGLAMLLGMFPGSCPTLCAELGIAQTPGGAWGQRLCGLRNWDGSGGWLTIALKPLGAGIVATATLVFSCVFTWRHIPRRPKQAKRVPKPKSPKSAPVSKPQSGYTLPPLTLLNEVRSVPGANDAELHEKMTILQNTLDSFGLDAEVKKAVVGPRITRFEVHLASGLRVERISSLAANFAMALRADSRLRILAPIPGRDAVGIEVPNDCARPVTIRALLSDKAWRQSSAGIPLALGHSIGGKSVILDVVQAPHLLVAGATGSGKSVCMNTLLLSLVYRFSPDDLKLILVDPKVVEFSAYAALPHLVAPVITDVKQVPMALDWAIEQMESRYLILAAAGVRNIADFNAQTTSRLPYLVIIIDELADIMLTAKASVEISLARLAQLARAVGIHVVVATQRPDVRVITGTIKANFPIRIAFQVSSQIDSRTIINCKGAETLLGLGDMLFCAPGSSSHQRLQGAFVTDQEIQRVVAYVAAQVPQRPPEFGNFLVNCGSASAAKPIATDDPLIQQAIEIITRDRKASISYLQRRLRIGYNKAALIVETLEERGILGPQPISGQREILIPEEKD